MTITDPKRAPACVARLLGAHTVLDHFSRLALDVELPFVVEVALGTIGQERSEIAQP